MAQPGFAAGAERLPVGDALRAQAVQAMQRLDTLGLNRGSTGNLSLRCAHDERAGMLITLTGMPVSVLAAQQMVWVGDDGDVVGDWQPSSEWHFHQAVYRTRADVHAVVHTHSVHATALACLDRGLPAFHYRVAVAGGDSVPCTPYHVFGSEALSLVVATALANRDACLMARHGLVAAGETLELAMKIAIEIEALCETYQKALAVAEPRCLSADEMAAVIEKFKTYGQARRG
jgi:L-fuculose-phosphate aldolase